LAAIDIDPTGEDAGGLRFPVSAWSDRSCVIPRTAARVPRGGSPSGDHRPRARGRFSRPCDRRLSVPPHRSPRRWSPRRSCLPRCASLALLIADGPFVAWATAPAVVGGAGSTYCGRGGRRGQGNPGTILSRNRPRMAGIWYWAAPGRTVFA
jgi:hypothetical protein